MHFTIFIFFVASLQPYFTTSYAMKKGYHSLKADAPPFIGFFTKKTSNKLHKYIYKNLIKVLHFNKFY